MVKKPKKQISYAELRFYLKQLERENKIAKLSIQNFIQELVDERNSSYF